MSGCSSQQVGMSRLLRSLRGVNVARISRVRQVTFKMFFDAPHKAQDVALESFLQ